MKKKNFVIVFVIGCLLLIIGCGLKLISVYSDKNVENKEDTMLSAREAITGEVGYYLENDNLIVSYDAKNKADNTVLITSATFIIQEFDTNKEIYRKTIEVNKQVKAKKEIKIDFEGVEFDANELLNYDLKVAVE